MRRIVHILLISLYFILLITVIFIQAFTTAQVVKYTSGSFPEGASYYYRLEDSLSFLKKEDLAVSGKFFLAPDYCNTGPGNGLIECSLGQMGGVKDVKILFNSKKGIKPFFSTGIMSVEYYMRVTYVDERLIELEVIATNAYYSL